MSVQESFRPSTENFFRLYAAFGGFPPEQSKGSRYNPLPLGLSERQFYLGSFSSPEQPRHRVAMAAIEVFCRLAETPQDQNVPIISVESLPALADKIPPAAIIKMYGICADLAVYPQSRPMQLTEAKDRFIRETCERQPSRAHLIAMETLRAFALLLTAASTGGVPKISTAQRNI
jgi:hypothetical protein